MFGRKLTFDDLICEDGVGVLRPHPLTLVDLAGIPSKIQQTTGTAPQRLPYPGEFIFEELADLYIDAGKVHQRLDDVRANPLIRDNPNATKAIDKAVITLSSIKKLVKIIAKQLDGLTIDKLGPEDKVQ